MRYWVQLATEQFPPSELVDQAIEAERAGFDGLNVSDHFQPWWEPGHSGQAWALLGAMGALRTYRERVLPALKGVQV
jgi:coenzyme F420-dependent glucose-6-phosphate dehydrogenase